MADDDKDKTAFVTRNGLWRFKRMPFGLCNAPGSFQRMMDCVLRGRLWVCCLVYLDDIVINTKGSMERHVVEAVFVLERLRAAGLSLKMSKCRFATQRLEYLWHELTPDGVRPLARLTDSVRNYPKPENDKELKRFVHMAGFYRRFIQDFGRKAKPLTYMLRKNVDWQWKHEQENAFQLIKNELSERPLLRYLDFRKVFVLVTDASEAGLGAVLVQDTDGALQPVAYTSKATSPAEAKYPITELGCFALVWSVKLFRPYLYDRMFTVMTYQAALKWLMTTKQLAGRLHRRTLALQENNFNIAHTRGKANAVPGALSWVRSHVGDEIRVIMLRRKPEPRVTADESAVVLHVT